MHISIRKTCVLRIDNTFGKVGILTKKRPPYLKNGGLFCIMGFCFIINQLSKTNLIPFKKNVPFKIK